MTTNNTIDVTTVEGIQAALAANTNTAMSAILEELLKSKKREVELIEKAAKAKKTSTKKSGFTVYESIAKSLFVALRPYVDEDGVAENTFKAAVAVLTDNDLSLDLQEKIFASSTVHCSKSNFNKCGDITTAYNSYIASAEQAKVLLPFIEQGTWDTWQVAVEKAAKAAANKRDETWLTPTEQAEQDAAAAKAEQAAAEQAKAEQAKAEQAAAAKKGKRK